MRFHRFALAPLVLIAFVFVLSNSVSTYAQGTIVRNKGTVPSGQKMMIQGIVSKRGADSFNMVDASSTEWVVILSPSTQVKTHRKGLFQGSKTYGATYILRGLRLQASGVGNGDGALIADTVKFDEQDLRTAQALQQTDILAQENAQRLAEQEANAKRLADQIAENQALTAQAQASADAAQARADAAMKQANYANDRINGLDDYDTVRTLTVYFRPGSSVLLARGKADIDAGAAWVRSQDTRGWMVAVVGFADSSGNTARNRALSERRANAVIGYLVMKHNLPLQRLIQPFGYGDSNPASSNTSAEGRAKNRRVEIRILVNKGIAGTVQ